MKGTKSSKMEKSKFLIIDRVKDLVLLQKLTSLGHVKKWHKPFSMWFFLSSESGSGVVCYTFAKSVIDIGEYTFEMGTETKVLAINMNCRDS